MLGMTWSDAMPWLMSDLLLPVLIVAAAAYFCGCFNGAVIVSKYILRDDVRGHGSGNAGLTNFYRTFGGKLTLAVILCDVLKAVAAVWIGILVARYWDNGFWRQEYDSLVFSKYWAALWCLLGHMFPCMFRFKGGKGILSGGAIVLMLDWRLALLAWGAFLLPVVLTRYVSLGSIAGAASFPAGTWLFVSREPAILALSFLMGGLVLWMHRGNISRLLKGQERKLTFHKEKEETP